MTLQFNNTSIHFMKDSPSQLSFLLAEFNSQRCEKSSSISPFVLEVFPRFLMILWFIRSRYLEFISKIHGIFRDQSNIGVFCYIIAITLGKLLSMKTSKHVARRTNHVIRGLGFSVPIHDLQVGETDWRMSSIINGQGLNQPPLLNEAFIKTQKDGV